ncbi:cellulose binding domain-containing protein [Actinocrispum wychmicini]|uniref:Glycosyl hydrolase family 18 (Putative chitinase) n=1 Tax=Actinocrispum wychmicini TaxID=1213861 RepID=A0A4R2JNJ9_9PSEU|nr:cellulose binding domain-containing protein [Actinocrispum wychmicini]TCO60537.1 glycosyl hydrolase family 18 (putative chitinase) [Actinocrispum wychmicini]
MKALSLGIRGKSGLVAIGALIVAGVSVPTTTAEAATALPTAVFTKSSDWGTGFSGSFTVTNSMSVPLTSWTVVFTLPATEKVTSLWNAQLTTNGNTYTAKNLSWNAPLAPGATADFAFNASNSGTFQAPSACTLNGNPCDGSADTTPPSTPTGLTVLSTTANSVSMNWTAATDNLIVSGYNVFQGTTKVASTPGTVTTVSGLSPSTTYTFSVQAVDQSGNTSAKSTSVTATTQAGGGSNHLPGIAAPFVDLGAFPTPNLTQIAETTGLRAFTLGFIVNGTTSCQATWFNAFTMSQGFARDDINSLRALGADVKPSFGGEAGTELAQSCTDVNTLTAQYQSVIDAYSLTQIDFDIEGSAVADPPSIDRRSQAMANLQAAAKAKGKSLAITLTLPVLPSGLTTQGVSVVRSAVSHGVAVSTVNVMAMDFGDIEAPNPSGRMGMFAIQSGQSTHNQIAPLLPGKTDAQIWNMIGITPMLGQNDNASEVFTQSDMRQLLTFAGQQHIGELAFWDVTRDGNACTGSLSKCTNISQTPFEFSKIIAPFTG